MAEWRTLGEMEGGLSVGARVWWQRPTGPLNGVVQTLLGTHAVVYFGKLGEVTVPVRELTPTDTIVIYD
jgi:hypothetical protein